MAIELDCPRCNRSLSLADELAGQYAQCKHCEGRIWVAAPPPPKSSEPSSRSQPPPVPSVTGPTPGGDSGHDEVSPTPLPTASHVAAPPMANTTDMPTQPPPTASADTNSSDIAVERPVSPPPIAASPANPPPPPKKNKRVAELIAAEPAQSRLEVGPGGDLPELSLSAGEDQDSDQKQKKKSNDWLVFAVIIMSLVVSTAMLMIESETSQSVQGETKQHIRDKIKAKYFGPPEGPWRKYQQRLRDAALARSQGDFEKEEQYYRLVLYQLNAADLDKTDQGVTGLRRATRNDASLPSDEELKTLLHALLYNN